MWTTLIGGLVTVTILVLKWYYGTGLQKKEYYELKKQLEIKQKEREVALQSGDLDTFYRLNELCLGLSKSIDSLRSRLKSSGVDVE